MLLACSSLHPRGGHMQREMLWGIHTHACKVTKGAGCSRMAGRIGKAPFAFLPRKLGSGQWGLPVIPKSEADTLGPWRERYSTRMLSALLNDISEPQTFPQLPCLWFISLSWVLCSLQLKAFWLVFSSFCLPHFFWSITKSFYSYFLNHAQILPLVSPICLCPRAGHRYLITAHCEGSAHSSAATSIFPGETGSIVESLRT